MSMGATDGRTKPEASTDLEQLRSDLDRFGYCIAANLIPPDRVAAIRARFLEQAAAERRDGHERTDKVETVSHRNQWVYMLVNKGIEFREPLLNPTALALVRHVLGPEILLSDYAAHVTHPGNRMMDLHIDQWWMPHPRMPGEPHQRPGTITRQQQPYGEPVRANHPLNPPVVCNCFWAITDFTPENGATRLVPESHLSGKHPDPARLDYPEIQAEAPAGSAIIWEGRPWHGAGINRSRGPRIGVSAYFTGPQFRQMANWTYGAKPEAYADAPQALKDLLGFKVWGGYGATGDPDATVVEPAERLIGVLR
jgi:ectoine hydroxylase-related dioxygenase (phytanoyl-CoA dioxygenase family)